MGLNYVHLSAVFISVPVSLELVSSYCWNITTGVLLPILNTSLLNCYKLVVCIPCPCSSYIAGDREGVAILGLLKFTT